MPYHNLDEKEKFFQCSKINSPEAFDDFYKSLNEQNKRFAFRGVKDAKFNLFSSAQVNAILKKGSFSQEQLNQTITDEIECVKKSKRIMKILKKRTNDTTNFQILALLQHYTFGTTVLDFTYQLLPSLFFATDGLIWNENHKPNSDIDDYFSIYYFNIDDSEHCSIQEVYAKGLVDAEGYDQMAKIKYGKLYSGLSDQTKSSFINLPYSDMAACNNGNITIAGRYGSVYTLKSRSTGLDVTYDISNERADTQKGLFKLNVSASLPFEQAANEWYSNYYLHLFCVNIHKSIANHIIKKYLEPNGISSKTIYPKTSVSKKIIRELLKLPIDSILRPRTCPQNMSIKTWHKYEKLYRKRLNSLSNR